VVLAAVFSDAGISGGADIDARPGLVAALAQLRASHAGVLVVAKRDRLARDVYVAATIDRVVAAAGGRVACADGVGNGDSASDAFMRTILDGAAAYERALIRARTKAALAAKRARGEKTGGSVPYGYDVDSAGRLVENQAEQGVLFVVRELRAAGLSLRAVVRELGGRGLVSRAGSPFQLTQVARMAAAA
jgi:DNA invertase Pin-like site-specific DNA recombinase